MVTPAPPRPAVTIAKPPHSSNPAGILPVSTAGPKPKVNPGPGQSSRHQSAGLKVNIRRLPPGLTEEEFQAALGSEWHPDSPNVDWYSYVPGKVSKDPAKPSRPSRAYLHLCEAYVKEHAGEPLKELQAKVASTSFIDARGTHHDSALLAPWPTVVESPYGRIPSTKVRKDNRQSTIDQDPEFIDFLQELTNPLVKPTPIDTIMEKENKPEEKTITPLVQYLKDKKANKAKESKAAKQSKHDAKDSKDADKKSSKPNKESEKKQAKAEKATKEPIKVLNKKSNPDSETKASTKAPKVANTTPSDAPDSKTASANPASKPEKKRERGSVAAAAKILQRELGLAGGGSRRRKDTGKGTKEASKDTTTNGQSTQSNTATGETVGSSDRAPKTTPTDSAPATSAAPPAPQDGATEAPSKKSQAPPGQRATKAQKDGKQAQPSTKSTAASKASAPAASALTPSPTATEAFLKHANPSQGISEALLQSTFASFGTVTKVEIDKKKGFAYLDFAEPEALQKAILASPVKIAQGAVVVLERKTTTSSQAGRGARAEGRGGRGGGGGGAANAPSRGGRGRGRGGRQQGAAGGEGSSAVKAAESAPTNAT